MSAQGVTTCRCGCGVDVTREDVSKFANYAAARGFRVSSVSRCASHNLKEGGSPKSRHLEGDAVDIHFPRDGKWNKNFLEMIVYSNPDTIIHYPWGFHLDWRRGTIARCI